ncbi:MAG: hypothetical protein IPN76_31220 [Saprospiraceae bacterium]|jgi:hypothetical protein|nr:hypothetical protein [Saprospiraceae bacterium]
MKEKESKNSIMDFHQLVFSGDSETYRNFAYLIVRTASASFLVFLRHKFGSRTLSASTIFWSGAVMVLFLLKELTGLATRRFSVYEGNPEGANVSTTLFWLHFLLFIGLTLYHIYESRKNLRRADGKEEIRHGMDTGLSVFYPLVANLLKPFGFVYDGVGKPRWYHLNEYKFQKWAEPLALILIGIFFKIIGFGVYGTYFIFGAICIKYMISLEEDKFFQFKQNHWDSKIGGEMISEVDGAQPVNRRAGMVVQQTLMRSDGGFQQWKEQKDKNELFDDVRPINNVHKNPPSSVEFKY